jgi:hypothetical protein
MFKYLNIIEWNNCSQYHVNYPYILYAKLGNIARINQGGRGDSSSNVACGVKGTCWLGQKGNGLVEAIVAVAVMDVWKGW